MAEVNGGYGSVSFLAFHPLLSTLHVARETIRRKRSRFRCRFAIRIAEFGN
jgi:hypothetical protein